MLLIYMTFKFFQNFIRICANTLIIFTNVNETILFGGDVVLCFVSSVFFDVFLVWTWTIFFIISLRLNIIMCAVVFFQRGFLIQNFLWWVSFFRNLVLLVFVLLCFIKNTCWIFYFLLWWRNPKPKLIKHNLLTN